MSKHKAHESWQPLQNSFYNATVNSYKTFDILSTDHLAKLSADRTDTLIDTLYNSYLPVYQAFQTAYTEWRTAKGFYKSATQRVDAKQDLLIKLIGKWDVIIQNEFYTDTAEYTSLMPNGRSPFQHGGREQRRAAVGSLVEALRAYPILSALQVEVETFSNDLIALRHRQQELEHDVDRLSEKVSAAHQAASNALYRNLGLMMYSWGPDFRMTTYFELSLIRKTSASTNEEDLITPDENIAPDDSAPADEAAV